MGKQIDSGTRWIVGNNNKLQLQTLKQSFNSVMLFFTEQFLNLRKFTGKCFSLKNFHFYG